MCGLVILFFALQYMLNHVGNMKFLNQLMDTILGVCQFLSKFGAVSLVFFMLRWLSLILSMLSYIQPLFFDKHRLFL